MLPFCVLPLSACFVLTLAIHSSVEESEHHSTPLVRRLLLSCHRGYYVWRIGTNKKHAHNETKNRQLNTRDHAALEKVRASSKYLLLLAAHEDGMPTSSCATSLSGWTRSGSCRALVPFVFLGHLSTSESVDPLSPTIRMCRAPNCARPPSY